MTNVFPLITRSVRSCPSLLISLCLSASVAWADAPTTESFNAGAENRLGLTFSPDGNTAYWVEWNGEWGKDAVSRRMIFVSNLENGQWTTPRIAPFSGIFNDDDPFVSPDGEWVYFVSDRPVDSSSSNTAGDIWRYRLVGEPVIEWLPVNSPATEYSPVVTSSGALYFASSREGGDGQGDLYRAEPVDSSFGEPERLGPAVNSETGEWNLWVSADESEIVFEASSRLSNISEAGDLYYSWKSEAGWVPASPLVSLNTSDSDLMPRPSPDGSVLYYGRGIFNGNAAIQQARWQEIKSEVRAGFAPMLMVANRSSAEVMFVDLAEGRVVDTIETGAGPHLLSNVDNGRVLVSGYGVYPKPHREPVTRRPPFIEDLNSRLLMLDVHERSVLADIVVPKCLRPHATWLIRHRAYITCEDEKYVLELNVRSGRPVTRFQTQQAGSHVLSYDPATRTLAVSNTESASVTLIDPMEATSRIVRLGPGSEGSRLIRGHFWIANSRDSSVSIVDPRSAREIRRIQTVCSFPIAFDTNADEDQVWLACLASGEIVQINPRNFAVLRRIVTDGSPINIAVHPSRNLAYLSMPRENAIHEFDLQTGQTIRVIPVGIEPDGLRWIPPRDL